MNIDNYTYVYYDPGTGQPFYVGKGSNNRAYDHLNETLETTNNLHKFYKINKIHLSNKEPIIRIFPCASEKEAYALEEFLTHHWELKCKGGLLTNMQYGGPTFNFRDVPKSEEHKRKIGQANKLANQNPETTERKRIAALGNTRGTANKGRIWSKESLQKMSDTKKKKFKENPELHPMLGKKHSEESLLKMRSSKLGKKYSKETIDKKSKCWIIEFPDGKKETIKNLSEFCRNNKLSQGNLISTGHTKGFKATKITESSPAA